MEWWLGLNWRSILLATCFSLIVSVLIGVAAGLLGSLLLPVFLPADVDLSQSAIATIIGFIVSLIPEIAGTYYLLHSIDNEVWSHTLAYGLLTSAIQIVLFISIEWDSSELFYLLSIIPTIFLTAWVIHR